MTVEARVTKLLCPCCEGSGISPHLGFTCMWCGGRKRVPPETAIRYADQNYIISFGVYVEGGTLEELRGEEAKSERIYAFLGKTPPWLKKGART